eukprot:NODE_2504_length_2201_cov_4.042430.p1 GENE.NODE_2504_length_2201_cov_4.042430~~NODE_2504_length_2201_cov_4.042430.p1  ORF type:complete len:672 (-),score=231.04 NODE_2504_length_2201_cov_4.042430:184-2199(-)
MGLSHLDEPVDRVCAMALSTFVSFGEGLDQALMLGYARAFMEKLVVKLHTTTNLAVREEAITGIAIIAGTLEKDFSEYYDTIMPMLKTFVMNVTDEKLNKVRGKSFECMTLLGSAVGKEKFLPDARDAIEVMMATPLQADDVQREYIREAYERICKCLGRDFAHFLPTLLPQIFAVLKLEDESEQEAAKAKKKSESAVAADGSSSDDDDSDDDFVEVATGEGKLIRVRSARFQEMEEAADLLQTIVGIVDAAFFPHVATTAEAILPLLTVPDGNLDYADQCRSFAAEVWALLIKAAKSGAKEQGIASDLHTQLFQKGLQTMFAIVAKNDDPETLADIAHGITESIKAAGECLTGEEIREIVKQVLGFMDQSFKRTETLKLESQVVKAREASAQAARPELNDECKDDEDDDEDEIDEEGCRRRYGEILGALMQVVPEQFMLCLEVIAAKIQQWTQEPQNKVLALHTACDVLEHLKEKSEVVWPAFMEEVFCSLDATDPELRTASSYAIALAARLPNFAGAADKAFLALGQIVETAKPKKKDEKARVALDNAVCALLSLATCHAAQCPTPERINEVWGLVLRRLPLKADTDEAMKVHADIVDLVIAEHPGLLAHLGKVLSLFAEIYKTDSICTTETDTKIEQVFRSIPRNILQENSANLSAKQMKKIEKILTP